MSRSTFNGPVLVGVENASYPVAAVATTGPNWGFVNMSQSAAITQSSSSAYPTSTTAMTMVIPAKSTITRISVLVTVVWDEVADIGQAWGVIGADVDANDLVNDLSLSALGLVVVGPGDTDDLTGTDINNWMNNSMEESPTGGDRCIVIRCPGGGGLGEGVLTVNYCQAVDLSAIA